MMAIKRPGGHRSRQFVSRTFDASADMEELAQAFLWRRISERPADPARDIKHRIRWEVFPGVDVTYLEDPAVASSYSIVTSTVGAPPVDSVSAVLEAAPHVLLPDELIGDVESAADPEALSIAIVRLGLGAPEQPDDRFVERISAAADDPSDLVREAAIWAMTFAEWPVFRTTLTRLKHGDPDERIRGLAEAALEALEGLGRP